MTVKLWPPMLSKAHPYFGERCRIVAPVRTRNPLVIRTPIRLNARKLIMRQKRCLGQKKVLISPSPRQFRVLRV